jgi:hypothetical protein
MFQKNVYFFNLEWIAKPPLPEEVVKVTEEVWDIVKDRSADYTL